MPRREARSVRVSPAFRLRCLPVAAFETYRLGFESYPRLGAVFVVVRSEIDYVRPALRGELVEARTWISSVVACAPEIPT